MKTLQQVQQQIELIQEKYEEGKKAKNKMSTAMRKELSKQLTFLNSCKYYLETNPRPEFVQSELTRTQDRLTKINTGYDAWKKSNEDPAKEAKNPKTVYNKEMGTRLLKGHLKTLKFLMSE